MKLNKQYIVFIIVFSLLIISMIYRVKNPFIQEEVDTLTYTGKKKGEISLKKNKNKNIESQSVTLVSRFLNRPEFSGAVFKDLFSLYNHPDDLKGTEEIASSIGKITGDKRINEKDIKYDPASKITDDLLSYRFYGTFKSRETRAIFLVRDKLVLVASVGDRIEGKYLIEDIQDNYIRIKALDLNETIHIDMREFNNE